MFLRPARTACRRPNCRRSASTLEIGRNFCRVREWSRPRCPYRAWSILSCPLRRPRAIPSPVHTRSSNIENDSRLARLATRTVVSDQTQSLASLLLWQPYPIRANMAVMIGGPARTSSRSSIFCLDALGPSSNSVFGAYSHATFCTGACVLGLHLSRHLYFNMRQKCSLCFFARHTGILQSAETIVTNPNIMTFMNADMPERSVWHDLHKCSFLSRKRTRLFFSHATGPRQSLHKDTRIVKKIMSDFSIRQLVPYAAMVDSNLAPQSRTCPILASRRHTDHSILEERSRQDSNIMTWLKAGTTEQSSALVSPEQYCPFLMLSTHS